MLLNGKVTQVYEDDRVFVLHSEENDYFIHITIKELRIYKVYLDMLPNIILETDGEKEHYLNGKLTNMHELLAFKRISVGEGSKEKVYFDQDEIQTQVKEFINGLEYKMFLDLEFSWPVPYTHMPSEIVQYGYIIVDGNDKVIEKRSSLIKPLRKSALNKKTLQFLGRKEEDFTDACSYISFYQDLAKKIDKYNIKIIAWGKNDLIALEKSFRLNHLAPLDVKSRFINIMQVMKNYYQLRKEMGLFETYKKLTNSEYHEQTHDALEDAYLAKEIFMIFKENINK